MMLKKAFPLYRLLKLLEIYHVSSLTHLEFIFV